MREVMKLALEYLEESDNYLGSLDHSKPIAALRQAIEQIEKQKPIGWISRESQWRLEDGGNANGTVPIHAKPSNTSKYPVYTAPQLQNKWVGLTDEEMRELEKEFHAERVRTSDEEYLIIYPGDYWAWQRAIEAKLKEKNT